jgi:hypothetical protein
VPPWLVSVILRCLAKKREDRFASADEVLLAIQSAGADHTDSPQNVSDSRVNEPEVDVAPQPEVAKIERSPLVSWLHQTLLTLLWILRQTGLLLGKIARQLWPLLLRAAAIMNKWGPIAMAKLSRGWQILQPILLSLCLRAKQWFLGLPRRMQAFVVALGLASLVWLMWPKPENDIAAATITWTTPPPEYQPEQASSMAPVISAPEPAPARETFYEHEPHREEVSVASPLPKREESAVSLGLQQIVKSVDSAVTEVVDCFNGKAACPTPAPEPQRRGGG